MKFYDISVPISPKTPPYPGDPGVSFHFTKQREKGDPFNLTALELSTHTGTHVDAPYHMLDGGARVDQLPLDALIGPALVWEAPGTASVSLADLKGLPRTRRLLIKSRNSGLWDNPAFQRDFLYIEPEAARRMVERGVRLVGIDYLSVEKLSRGPATTHHILLGAGVVVLEGLDLRGVPPGRYDLVCLPLRIEGGDGAPCRAVLMKR